MTRGLGVLFAATSLASVIACDRGHATSGSAVGPVVAPPEPVTSGARLRARWQVADGAERLVGWHDRQLDVDCDFGVYVAGRKHACLPKVAVRRDDWFADASCAKPLALAEPGVTPRWAIASPANACDADPALFEVGPAVDPAAGAYTVVAGSCVRKTVDVPAPLYEIGAPVAVTTFVSATEQGDAVGQMWLVADDGARVPWGGWDGTRAVEPTLTNDEGMRWGPWIVAYGAATFADAACTVPAASKEAGTARCPLDAALVFPLPPSATACGVSFFALGAPLASGFTPAGANGACEALDMGPTQTGLVFALGGALDATLLEAGTTLVGAGAAKVRYATMSGRAIRQTASNAQLGGNAPPPPDAFVDAATGADCEPQPATDGVVRCLPVPANLTTLLAYDDAACTDPVVVLDASASASTCGAPTLPKLLAWSDAPGAPVHVRTVDAPSAPIGTPLFGFENGSCGPSARPAAGSAIHRTGAEVAPSAFAAVTERVD